MQHATSRGNPRLVLLTALWILLPLWGCAEDDTLTGAAEIFVEGQLPDRAAAGAAVPGGITVVVADQGGNPQGGIDVRFSVTRGGGTVDPELVTTNADGRAHTTWTLGPAPVLNRLNASIRVRSINLDVSATRQSPLVPEPFSDVDGYLTSANLEGSTEDLAFDGADGIVMGVPGGLIYVEPNADVSMMDIRGDAIDTALGVAFDGDGNLWIADSTGSALRRLAPDGVVTTHLSADTDPSLQLPNYVAIGPDGWVYVSDSCAGVIVRYDPAGAVAETVTTTDIPTEGGPNGLAIDATGDRLYFTTENTAIFCEHEDVGLVDPVAGLYVVDVSPGRFGLRESVAEGIALFGDGLAFDVEGNLYAIFDTNDVLNLEESTIWVLPEGESALLKLAATADRVMANLAFAPAGFGDDPPGTLYISVLAVPPFTDESTRGLLRLEVGIDGQPLLSDGGE